jgi:multidrug resistance efflux pump
MFVKFILPIIALAGLAFAASKVYDLNKPLPASVVVNTPPQAPKMRSIAGAGIVEAKRENIPVGTTVPGIVDKVFASIDQKVKTGDPLFHIDDRDLQAELVGREAAVAATKAQLDRLKAAPRAEDIPPARASVEEAKAKLEDARAAYRRTKHLFDRSMATGSENDRDNYMEKAAEAALARSEAELKKLLAGSWKEDIRVAEAALLQAEAQVISLKKQIERLTVKALADGKVLQVHVRPGQYAAPNWNEALLVLGDVDTLHVRVDIDENDLAYFKPGAEAQATLKGRPNVKFGLEYVKTEPYVIPKKSLTGDNSERVDTRVLQAIYAIKDKPIDVYVGQQMDVYIKSNLPKDLDMNANPDLPKPDLNPSDPKAPSPTAEPKKAAE